MGITGVGFPVHSSCEDTPPMKSPIRPIWEISSRHDMLCNIIPKSLNRATLEDYFRLLHERTPPRYQVSASIREKSLLFFSSSGF